MMASYRCGERIPLGPDGTLQVIEGVIALTAIHEDGTEVLLGLCGPGQVVAGHADEVCCIQLRAQTAAGSALPVPALNASQLAVIGQWLRELGDINIQADGITNGVEWNLDDYSPWWWLFTRDHVAALLRIAGFEVESVAGYWEGRATYFRARAV